MQELLKGEKFLWVDLIGHLVIGALTGVSMAKMAVLLGMGVDGQHLLSAWGGVVGLKAFDFVKSFIEKK